MINVYLEQDNGYMQFANDTMIHTIHYFYLFIFLVIYKSYDSTGWSKTLFLVSGLKICLILKIL